MKQIEVVAAEDRSRAEGGHAVILLLGVERAPANVSFGLKPVASEGDDADVAVLSGLTDLQPRDATITAEGLALSVGPEIAESARFVPGAVVEITLPEMGVRGEFLWPSITPLARPKRRNIMLRRNAADPPTGRAGTAGAPRPAAVEPAVPPMEPRPTPVAAPTTTPPGAEPAAAIETPPEPARRSIADRPAVPAEHQPPTPARRPTLLSSAVPRRPMTEPISKPEREEALGAITAEQPRAPEPEPAAAIAGQLPRESKPALAGEAIGVEAPAEANLSERLRRMPAASGSAAPASPPPAAPAGQSGRRLSTGSAVALAVGTLVAGQLVAFRALNLRVVPRHAAAAGPAAPVPAPAAAPPRAEPSPAAKAAVTPPSPPQRSVYEVIAAGPRSPRGVAAADVSPAKALQLAHTLLHGTPAERDPEEAAYWLKHYLSGSSGGDTVRIALTQLGSAYAQPVRGERDVASARIVWEMSSGLGDPVAMCFIGAMHEHGLGVPKSSGIATAWYDRAAVLGRSCTTVSQGAGGDKR